MSAIEILKAIKLRYFTATAWVSFARSTRSRGCRFLDATRISDATFSYRAVIRSGTAILPILVLSSPTSRYRTEVGMTTEQSHDPAEQCLTEHE